MYCRVNSSTFLLMSFGRPLSPDNKGCVKKLHLKDRYIQMVAVMRGEWPSGLNSFRQVNDVKLGRVKSNSGWVTSEA